MVHSDENGLVLPPKIAPKQVVIVPIGSSEEVKKLTNEIYIKLKNSRIITYVDDSEKSPGFRFAESEVNWIPVRIEIGERDLKEGKITFARRDTREKIVENSNIDVIDYVIKLLEEIKNNLYNRALQRRNELTYEAKTIEEVERIMNDKPGFVKAMWCGNEECELKMKEIKGTKSRCILENEKPINDKCVVCGKKAKHLVVWGIQY